MPVTVDEAGHRDEPGRVDHAPGRAVSVTRSAMSVTGPVVSLTGPAVSVARPAMSAIGSESSAIGSEMRLDEPAAVDADVRVAAGEQPGVANQKIHFASLESFFKSYYRSFHKCKPDRPATDGRT
ncbi:hypothetical protein Q0Z83_018220 [Actinoplanes sichuanensis]|uniref:Uncharacterized protein n=1 Tax=Actinoplanes sichuanensis TaxID=512349 RepID=A0ABW4A8Y0_9ACTN|nr:hypothetical protein [Actinoplanes sichuanensis]BEL03631.1 hypothetical protein Q0Z83_018220 [Actinoplanes sichuanensis]